MYRCLELASLGAGSVAPNPMVGAVLVYKDQIIGEGYHQRYGKAHAEVHTIDQVVLNGLSDRLANSTMYVSLEPCAHFGKTPPCADLIIKHKIPKVVVGCRDPFTEVDGKGIEKLKAAGVKVELGILEQECKDLNKRFLTFHTEHRPYIILKWAETKDGFMANSATEKNGERLLISNEYSNRLVHKWRSEEAAILIGTNTAQLDNPELTTRLWPGKSAIRLIVDMDLRLSESLKIFNIESRTIVFNTVKHQERDHILYYQVKEDVSLVHQLVNALYQLNIQSVLVEGGAKLLQSFIDEGMWDEARTISNGQLTIGNGLKAPEIEDGYSMSTQIVLSDKIKIRRRKATDGR